MSVEEPSVPLLSGPVHYHFNDSGVDDASSLVRRLVLFNIANEVNRKAGKENTHLTPSAAAITVLVWWRALVEEMAKNSAGGIAEDNWKKKMGCINCFPNSVRVDNKVAWVCTHTHCPWCYGRRIQKVINSVWYGDRERQVELMKGHRLWYMDNILDLPAKRPSSSRWNAEEFLRRMMIAEVNICQGYYAINRSVFKAAYWQSTSWPAEDRTGWCVRTGMFGIKKENTAEIVAPHGWHGEEGGVSEGNIEIALTDLLRYPTGFVCGDPGLRLKLIEARRDLRLCAAVGAFRAARSKKDAVLEA